MKSVTSDTPVYKQALAGAKHMGYEFFVSAVRLPDITSASPLVVTLRVQNTGVAPFYYDWPVELGVLDSTGNIVATYNPGWKLTNILPAVAGESPYVEWTYRNPAHQLTPGAYTLMLHVINPMSNGKTLKFANVLQDANHAGWLTLSTFEVR